MIVLLVLMHCFGILHTVLSYTFVPSQSVWTKPKLLPSTGRGAKLATKITTPKSPQTTGSTTTSNMITRPTHTTIPYVIMASSRGNQGVPFTDRDDDDEEGDNSDTRKNQRKPNNRNYMDDSADDESKQYAYVRRRSSQGRMDEDGDDNDDDRDSYSSNELFNRDRRKTYNDPPSKTGKVDQDNDDDYYDTVDGDDDTEYDDDDYDDDDDDEEDYDLLGNIIVPNPLLDSMDPDGAAERFPEIARDPKFWFEMFLFVVFLDFLSEIGPRNPYPDLPWF